LCPLILYIFFNFLHKILFFDNIYIYMENFNISASNLNIVEGAKGTN
jgi:hypothetical protein